VTTAAFSPPELEAQIPRLRRYARALTGNRDAADDLTQDTLERAWSRRTLWQPQGMDRAGSLRAWLFAVMHNVFVNGTRRYRIMDSLDLLGEAGTEFPMADGSAETGAALRELQAALLKMPTEQREVILLVGLEQLSYVEAATALDVPIGTVMSRLSRGRERLRQLLGEGDSAPTALRRVK
jgi:RNA polymerase sigma-70 factor (ECF subfamily)